MLYRHSPSDTRAEPGGRMNEHMRLPVDGPVASAGRGGGGGRDKQSKKILAVASGGGHWVQLLRMIPAFEDHTVVFVSTLESHRAQVAPHRFYIVTDGNRWNKFRLARMAGKLLLIMLRERPDIVISTGAAPGYFSLRFAKILGARTIWVDSIANAEQLSLSGEHAGRFADMWLTQWAHLAKPEGPHFKGSVI